MFNDSPELVKNFTALNYEGSLARISPHLQPAHPVLGGGWNDGEYFNLTGKDGWYVDSSTTDLQTTGQLEFKDKEGKYFSYIKGTTTTLQNLDEQEFSVQGIGVLGDTDWVDPGDPDPYEPPEELVDYCLEITPLADCDAVLGCMDASALNYNPLATINDGSCNFPIGGCMDIWAQNYDPSATYDDGSCIFWPILGCTDPTASNYDPTATQDDGSCIYAGCMDETADNFDPNATIDDGSCFWEGCTDPTALNYYAIATVDDCS